MNDHVRQKSVREPAGRLVTLSTDRLVLRPVEGRDVDDVFAIYSNTEALQYFAREPLRGREDAQRMIEENLVPGMDDKARVWAICLRDSDRMIGSFTLFHIDSANRRAEVGYILNQAFWGQGYASEALTRMIRHCFEDLGLARLEADVDPQNAGSLKLLERHAFEREGYFRKRWFVRGDWYDSVMFGLLREDLR